MLQLAVLDIVIEAYRLVCDQYVKYLNFSFFSTVLKSSKVAFLMGKMCPAHYICRWTELMVLS